MKAKVLFVGDEGGMSGCKVGSQAEVIVFDKMETLTPVFFEVYRYALLIDEEEKHVL